MDGFGLSKEGEGNAISMAKTPNLDKIFSEHKLAKLQASGEAVGLPAGQMGNSEVGHLNIGAGRVVYQELTRINKACADGSILKNEVLIEACKHAKENNGALHLMGLISDGGVHSSLEHLYALFDLAISQDVPHVFVHCFMDGRDVPPTSGVDYIKLLEEKITIKNAEVVVTGGKTCIEIASIQGRYYVMDRDKRWDRVEKGYDAIVKATPCEKTLTASRVCEKSYAVDVTDEFIVPTALIDRGMKDGDSVIFFNFRPDRARQITHALTDEDFSDFDISGRPNVHYVCLTEYDEKFTLPIAFPKEIPSNVLADVLSDAGLIQYHTAETEKYAHVTFFLNGGVEEPKKNEIRKLIDSPKVATYDLQPEMSAPQVTQTLCDAIATDTADVYIVNYANCDMVGHTGVLPAAIKAVEAVDDGVGKVVKAIEDKAGCVFITADHGNADCMIQDNGQPMTAHTTSPVPFVMVDFTGQKRELTKKSGALCDIAPTLLHAIEVKIPGELAGSSFL